MTKELVRIARVIGREGRMTERASLPGATGGWEASIDSVNSLIDDLVRPTTEVGRVMDAVAEGDLTQKMALTIEGQPVKGEFPRIGTTVNTMVDQLVSFADEVTRVAREVGTEGKLGGQAQVKGVSGTWKDLTDSVNFMASNLTDQVRNIAEVTTAVANGDLTQKITVDVKGEVLELKSTVNTMVDQLSSFADEVTRVAREVGTEGKLGGQAEVKGVSGTWRDLTENVNSMATNLTDQVRGIADVTTAVANGDLSQKITVEAKGEVAALADTINSMTDTLRVFAEQVTAWRARWAPRASSAARPRCRAWRHVEGPHRLRELHGRQPHRPGAQHRPGHHGGGRRRPVAEDHGRGEGRGGRARRDDQLDGRHAARVRRAGDRRWRARWARRASSAVRPRCRARRARGATSPTT